MSQQKLDPSDVVTEDRKSSRRDLLKGALIALGAGVILQPNGGVLAGAFGPEPKRKKKGPKDQEPSRKHGNRTRNVLPPAATAQEPKLQKKHGNKKAEAAAQAASEPQK